MNQANTLPKRSEIDPVYHWKTEDLFPSDSHWEASFSEIEKTLPDFSKMQGTLATSSAQLLHCLEEYFSLSEKLDALYVYAFLRFHEDSTNSTYQSLSARAESLLIQYSAASSFIVPELLSIPQNTLEQFLQEKAEEFKVYTHFINNILRQKEHTLSAAEEALLSEAGDLANAPQNIFTMINDADMKFPSIQNEKGETFDLTKGRYTTFLESPDRTLRKNAFDALYDTYAKQKNTLATTYHSSVKSDNFFAKARKYASAREAALEDDAIPLTVYDTLIETVHGYLPLLHRYISLRKKVLSVEELHMYDLYVPLIKEVNPVVSYEEAKKTVLEALSVMGEEYRHALEIGLNSGWIDVYENQGKRSGAYSWGSYSAHPYVLLNHNDNINSMFTLAHEMGHALHSYFTWKKQPYLYSGHKIFVAEVASTCNEALLMEYLLKTTEDKNTRLYLLNYFMEQFRGTFFRQTMFAEFEKITHEMAERGEPLTCEALSKLYYNLNKIYFGEDLVIDEKIELEWARIPHFYNAFYVYQYATGYSAAIALSQKILKEGAPAIKAYMDFLTKGNSEYSIDLLKGAGVDMTTAEPLKNAMQVFEKLLTEMEAMLL